MRKIVFFISAGVGNGRAAGTLEREQGGEGKTEYSSPMEGLGQ
jgi:hypothetical protein